MEVLIEKGGMDIYNGELKETLNCWRNYCKNIDNSLASSEKALKEAEQALERAVGRGNENSIKRSEKVLKKAISKFEEASSDSKLKELLTDKINNGDFSTVEYFCYSFNAEEEVKTLILVFKEMDCYFKRNYNIDVSPEDGELCKGIDNL